MSRSRSALRRLLVPPALVVAAVGGLGVVADAPIVQSDETGTSSAALRLTGASQPSADSRSSRSDRSNTASRENTPSRSQSVSRSGADAVDRPVLEPVLAVLPVTDYEITGTFGAAGSMWSADHTGLDFAAPYGTDVVAVMGGEVLEAAYDGAYGLRVVIRADDGSRWWYCHLAETDVQVGARLEAGAPVGSVGTSGNTTGPHLHLEVRRGGRAFDPAIELERLGLRP